MEIDPFSMLEVSLQEPEGSEAQEVCVNPMDSGEETAVNQELEPDQPMAWQPIDPTDAMEIVIRNGNKLACVSPQEEGYRKRIYRSYPIVLKKRLHCTMCDAHVGCQPRLQLEQIEHPLLKVLSCLTCIAVYKNITFPLSPSGRDMRCRWCTNPNYTSAPLRYCKDCPFAFCEKCIFRNFPLDEITKKNVHSWTCFVCKMSELWPARAVLWALNSLIQMKEANLHEKWVGDVSTCCKTNKNIGILNSSPSLLYRTLNERTMNGNHQNMSSRGRPQVIRAAAPSRPLPRAPINRRIQNAPLMKSNVHMNSLMRVDATKPLPACKYETQWLKNKINSVCISLEDLKKNLKRTSDLMSGAVDSEILKTNFLLITNLLEEGSSNLQRFTRELESDWKKAVEFKSYKTINKNNAFQRRVQNPPLMPVSRTNNRYTVSKSSSLKVNIMTALDQKILAQYNIKPCFVLLERSDVKPEVITIDDDDDE